MVKILAVFCSLLSLYAVCVYLLFYDLFFSNWVCWARGNFSGEPGHVHICICESLLCGVPGRYEYTWSLCRCGWRYSTDFLSSRLYFGMCGVIEQVRSLRDGTISSFLGFVLAGWYD